MSEETTTETQDIQTEGQAAPTESNVELTLQDLKNLKDIIDVASTRGAFRPNEMTAVGQTYTKLEKFLSAASASQQDKQEA